MSRAKTVIQGITFMLVPKTIEIHEDIENLSKFTAEYESGTRTVKEIVETELAFIRKTADCHIFDNIPFEKLDIDDVQIACIAIINGYKNKITRAKLDMMTIDAPKAKKKK